MPAPASHAVESFGNRMSFLTYDDLVVQLQTVHRLCRQDVQVPTFKEIV